LREIAEEMTIVLRALPDDRLWSAIVAGLMADHNVDELADWRKFYGAMRDMVNETGVTVR